jgi:hypothetical protein
MNDALRELVFEAHRQCEKKTYGWLRNPEELRQKFAEVIIRECAKICDERALSAPMGSDEQCEAEDCAQAIMKHFGVDK